MNGFSKINQLLNISTLEWPRVAVAWGMVFLSRVGFIVGGTILTALFLSKAGIELLPLLFLTNAGLMMLGTLLFRNLVHKTKGDLLIVVTVLLAASCLILSISLLETHLVSFFAVFMISYAILMSQLNILISLFNEELFTPLESQRTFPVIESAETLGGITGALFLTLYSDSLPVYKFILIWVILLLCILPIVLKYNARTMDIPKQKEEICESKSLKNTYQELKKIPFLKGLMFVVLLFWALINILEFQYTKAVQQDVLSHGASLLTNGYEGLLAEKLGTLHLIFNSAALLMQLIVAGRILSSLGVTSSMLLHPLVMLLNLVALSLRFNFFTAALARGCHEITGILFKSAYDSSYYVIPHGNRRDIKEFMQGIAKPTGAILGTLGILLLAHVFKDENQNLALNLSLTIICAALAFVLVRMNRYFTVLCEQNLSHKKDLPTRLSAVEILGERGHKSSTSPLQTLLERSSEPLILKEKILKTLGLLEDPEAISSILKMLEHPSEEIRFEAVEALSHYDQLRKHELSQSFTRHRVLESLKLALEKESNEAILEQLVLVFYKIEPQELTYILSQELKKRQMRPTFIRMLKLFKDPNLGYYLSELQNASDPELKAAAIVALWQFKKMRKQLKHDLMRLIESPKWEVSAVGIEALGHLKDDSFRPLLRTYTKHSSLKLQKAAVLALARLEDEGIIPEIIKHFFDLGLEFRNSSSRFLRALNRAMHMKVVEKINEILTKNKMSTLEEMERETLKSLAHLYTKISAHHEANKVKKVLDSKDSDSL